jgi:hypothetical protein
MFAFVCILSGSSGRIGSWHSKSRTLILSCDDPRADAPFGVP